MNDKLPLKGDRVLVVEDNYLLAMDVCEWLQAAGAEIVGPAPNAQEACRLLEDRAVDSAVVDINLGQGASYHVASRLTERNVPFIFATGYDCAAVPAEYQGVARLEKPFAGRDLVQAVQALR